MKPLDPFDLRCGVCGEKVKRDDLVAVVDHPFEKYQSMIVHTRHHGVPKLIVDRVQMTTGSKLQEIAWNFREEVSPEEALRVINEQFGIDVRPKGNLIRSNREW